MEFTLRNKAVIAVGKRGSGKSCLIKYLLNCERHVFSRVFLICPTERINGHYADVIPQECIFEKWSEQWISALIEKLTVAKSEGKKKNVLLILDDLVSDVVFHQSKALKQLFVRGRHLGLAVIISCQYQNSVPPIVRANADYVLCSQVNSASISLLSEEYLSGSITKKDFIELYHRNSTNYRFFVINCSTVKDNEDLALIYGNLKVPPEFID